MYQQSNKEDDIAEWLFIQQEILTRKSSFQLNQELFQGSKKNDPGPIKEIKTTKDLKDTYAVFNGLIYRCRFSKNLQQIFTKSRNQLKNKKHLKEIEKQCKNKIKRLLEILGHSQDQQEHWKLVLNHKNIIEHILKANVFLKHLLQTNFQLIKEGAAHIKNNQIPSQLQIQICILAIDVISLINNMRSLLLPFFQDENNSNSKVQIEQKIFLENALENANEGGDFNLLKNLDINRFLTTIKRITAEMKTKKYPFQVWASVQEIKQTYLVDNYGVWRKKFHQTAAKELILYWMQLSNKHFNSAFAQYRQTFNLKNIFKDYRIIFRYFLSEAIKRKQESVHVLQYLDLIQKVWVKLDLTSASNLFWQELALASKKITLPAQFFKNSKEFIVDIIENIISTFQQKKNKQFLEKLKKMLLDLSVNLLLLQSDEDLTQSYFLKCDKQIRLLLTQRSVLDDIIANVYKKVKKLEKEDQLFGVIKEVTHSLSVGIKQVDYVMQKKYEKQVFTSLYETYEDQHPILDQIKFFLLTSRCLTSNFPSNQQLQQCRSYYIQQRSGILTKEFKLSSNQINNLRFGLLDSIRILTFELVLNIKLNKPSAQLDRLKKAIYKLLKIYESKRNTSFYEAQVQQNTKQEQVQINSLLLRRTSSVQIDPNHFHIEFDDLKELELDDQKYNDFTMNYLKKIFELRVQMIIRGINDLQEKEFPLKQEFIDLKNRIYIYAANNEKDVLLREDIKKLAQIEFDFVKKRYFQAWSSLRKLKDIEGVNKILEKSWDGKRNLLKLFVTIFIKYNEPIIQAKLKGRDLQGKDIEQLLNDSLQSEHNRHKKFEEPFKQNLINAIRILDNIQKIRQLKKQLIQQDEQLNNMEEVKQFKTINQQVKFKQIQEKFSIHSIVKNDTIIMRKYTIKMQPTGADQIYKKLRKLTQFNRNITLEINKQKDSVTIKIDQMQNVFESYPKLVKYLIQSYLQIIQFCSKTLNFEIYPLLLHNHFKIHKKNDHNIILKMNPYEGILLNIILSYKQLKTTNYFKYPKYPFIELADQLAKKFEKDKIYEHKGSNLAQSTSFNHLIQEMKALSMENQGANPVETAKAILKCPYFWSSADKLFQIVQFKERYQSIVNIEQSRRKQNEKIRQSLTLQQRQTFTYWPPEKRHPKYKPAFGYNKTNQVYFSIQGLIEKQAFEQDIGNFKGKDVNQKYKFHGYFWSKEKTQIQRLVKMVAERQKKKGSKTSFYDKTFNSFQNQIRNLRNLSVHYIYDTDKKQEIDLQDKLNIFETYFPKLFVFLYRWRPFLGKDYVNEIKVQKVNFLRNLFCKEDNSEIILRLSNIKELQTYNIKNNYNKNYLLEIFKYDFAKINGCEPCKILCNSLKKQTSLWGFLQDVKRQNFKQGKDMTYNLLFWEHEKKGCNGMQYLIMPYFNVTQRNQFTTQEFAHVKSSLTLMEIERDRLNNKIQKQLQKKKLQMKQNKTVLQGQEGDSVSDAQSAEVQNKNKEPVEKRFKKLSIKELDNVHDELAKLDYVCKYFIYHLEMEFPYLFYDLRKERYQWDEKAWQFPKKQ